VIQSGDINPFARVEIFYKPLSQFELISLSIAFSEQFISKVTDTKDHVFQIDNRNRFDFVKVEQHE
jgi:hypothetical protein